MTREDIRMEMNACKLEVDRMLEQVDNVDGFEERMELINRAIAVADRMSKLDTMHKKILLEEHEAKNKELLSQLRKILRR